MASVHDVVRLRETRTVPCSTWSSQTSDPEDGRRVVCLEPKRRKTDDGIEILPVASFLEELRNGRLL